MNLDKTQKHIQHFLYHKFYGSRLFTTNTTGSINSSNIFKCFVSFFQMRKREINLPNVAESIFVYFSTEFSMPFQQKLNPPGLLLSAFAGWIRTGILERSSSSSSKRLTYSNSFFSNSNCLYSKSKQERPSLAKPALR